MRIKGLSDLRFGQAVFEVRYHKAHRYWDDCGKTIADLEQRLPGIECLELGPAGFRFSGTDNLGITAAQFYWDKLVVTAANPGAASLPSKFAATCAEFLRLVALHLGIEQTTFVGNRYWYYAPFESPSASQEWLAQQTLWSFAGTSTMILGRPTNEGLWLRTERDDQNVSLRLGSGSLSAGGKTGSGAIVDVDFTLRDAPSVTRFDVERRIRANVKDLDRFVAALFNQKQEGV